MTGHHSQRRSAAAHPEAAMIARLDQFAATIADARTQPNLAALADLEQQFLTGFHDVGAHLDRAQVGAAWMILGNLFAGYVGSLPPEQQGAGPVLVNLARLAGARLYTRDALPVSVNCPFAYGNGTRCAKEVTAPSVERLDTLMRAHIWQIHPGRDWPMVADAEGHSAMCVRCRTGVALFRHDAHGELCQTCYDALFEELQARTAALLAKDATDADNEAQG